MTYHFSRRKLIITGIYVLSIVGILNISFDTPSDLPTTQNSVGSTIQSIAAVEDNGRLIVWRNTLKMIRDHWFMGVGLENWALIYPTYDRGDLLTAETFLFRDLGATYHLQGDLDAALQSYRTSQTFTKDDAQIYLDMGAIYQEQNQMEKAIDAYNNFLIRSTDPDLTINIKMVIEEIRKIKPPY
jgi:tetratricopeptide (TPR) repeat protein